MDINCSIIRDVLPLYIEDICSDDTKNLVEAHKESCEECREIYRRMTAESISELTELVQGEKENKSPRREKPLNAKKVIKKIRRRWIALLLATLLFVPVGMLTVNQIRGAGLSYTAIPRVLENHAFMSAIVNEKYEKAFSYLDIESIFNKCAETEYTDFSYHPLSQYQQAKIDGSVYYITDNIYRNEYAQYLKDNDAVWFWFSLFLSHESAHDSFFLFPEEMMAEFRSKIAADENLSSMEKFLSEFHLLKGINGNYYAGAISSDMTDLTMELFLQNESFELYPEFYYNQIIQTTKENIAVQTAHANQYKELGLEAFTALSENAFMENLKSIASQGYKFSGYRLIDITFSRVYGKTQFQITYALNATKNAEPVTEILVYVICTSDGISSSGFIYPINYPAQLHNAGLVQTYYIPWTEQ